MECLLPVLPLPYHCKLRKSKCEIYPSISKYAGDIFKEINEILIELDWSYSDRFAVELSFDEAFINACEHGNKRQSEKKVTVSYILSKNQIQLSVADEGEGFCPEEVPDPRTDEGLKKCSGRGVFLIRNYMDQVFYNPKGNKVTMVKKRTNK